MSRCSNLYRNVTVINHIIRDAILPRRSTCINSRPRDVTSSLMRMADAAILAAAAASQSLIVNVHTTVFNHGNDELRTGDMTAEVSGVYCSTLTSGPRECKWVDQFGSFFNIVSETFFKLSGSAAAGSRDCCMQQFISG